MSLLNFVTWVRIVYKITFARQALKDYEKIKKSAFESAVLKIIKDLESDPLRPASCFKKLKDNLSGCYSRRINLKHRLTYIVNEDAKEVQILRMWTHYGDN